MKVEENGQTVLLDFGGNHNAMGRQSELCLAIMGMHEEKRHNFFEQFSEEDYKRLSHLSLSDDIGDKLTYGEQIEGFDLVYEITNKAVKQMAECLGVSPEELEVEYTVKSKESA